MHQIYTQAASLAEKLNTRAIKAAENADNDQDRLTAKDIAYAANRFKTKAEMAALQVVTCLNDGTLRAYCEQFDKTFKNFSDNAATWESDLARIESGKAI
jgi:hypothetical protein